MSSPFEISLITLGVMLSGLALYRLFPRLVSPTQVEGAKIDQDSEVQNNPTDHASSKLSDRRQQQEEHKNHQSTQVVHDFYAFLLKKPQDPLKVKSTQSNLLLEAFTRSWQDMLEDPALFPRQPLVLPKLLQAMRAESNNSQALMAIILEDPGLTADVLKLANSPIYRNTHKEMQSIEYALVMLGVDGLHSLVCSSVMKPIFAKRRSDGFNSALFWDWALLSAQSAQHYVKLHDIADPSIAYMLVLITRLSELVILRSCTSIDREHNFNCGVASIIPVVEKFRYHVADKLIQDWGFEKTLGRHLFDDSRVRKTTINDDLIILNAQQLAPEFGSISMLIKHGRMEPGLATRELLSTQISQLRFEEILGIV